MAAMAAGLLSGMGLRMPRTELCVRPRPLDNHAAVATEVRGDPRHASPRPLCPPAPMATPAGPHHAVLVDQ